MIVKDEDVFSELNSIIDALLYPSLSIYTGMPSQQAHDDVAMRLGIIRDYLRYVVEEEQQITITPVCDYDRAMKGIT